MPSVVIQNMWGYIWGHKLSNADEARDMARQSNTGKLSAIQLKQAKAKAKEKDYKLSDGGGLFVLVKANGSKYFKLKYRFQGKEKSLSFGVCPATT